VLITAKTGRLVLPDQQRERGRQRGIGFGGWIDCLGAFGQQVGPVLLQLVPLPPGFVEAGREVAF